MVPLRNEKSIVLEKVIDSAMKTLQLAWLSVSHGYYSKIFSLHGSFLFGEGCVQKLLVWRV